MTRGAPPEGFRSWEEFDEWDRREEATMLTEMAIAKSIRRSTADQFEVGIDGAALADRLSSSTTIVRPKKSKLTHGIHAQGRKLGWSEARIRKEVRSWKHARAACGS